MTHAERLRWLAEREIPCSCLSCAACGPCNDELYVARTDGTTYKHSPGCQLCGGTNKVAEFPWLRRECNHSHRDRQIGQCLESGCHGWVPRLDIPIEEVLANLTQAQRMAVLSDVRLVVTVGGPADFRLAFWQAVERVVNP